MTIKDWSGASNQSSKWRHKRKRKYVILLSNDRNLLFVFTSITIYVITSTSLYVITSNWRLNAMYFCYSNYAAYFKISNLSGTIHLFS